MYNQVCKNFAQFFNAENLAEKFSTKVDQTTFYNTLEQKATKASLSSLSLIVANMHTRLKQMSIL